MGRTVAELEDQLSAVEYAEWIEFFDLEPWGWQADTFRSGTVAATIANVNRDPRKRRKPFVATDFFPKTPDRSAKIDGKKLKAQLQAAYAGVRETWRNNRQK